VKAAAAREAQGAPKLSGEIRGAQAVAQTFSGRAQGAQPALVDGAVGAVWSPGGRPRAAFAFKIAHGKIVELQLTADPRTMDRLDVVILA
jgi:RNA polymerase sigma-70 factor (ECF subfamily)